MRNEIRACMGEVAAADGTAKTEFVFPASFKGFRGHFPGNPVVPGVCLVQCAMLLAEAAAGRPLRLQAIANAKFLATVGPGQPVQAECVLAEGVVRAGFASGETRIATLKLKVADA